MPLSEDTLRELQQPIEVPVPRSRLSQTTLDELSAPPVQGHLDPNAGFLTQERIDQAVQQERNFRSRTAQRTQRPTSKANPPPTVIDQVVERVTPAIEKIAGPMPVVETTPAVDPFAEALKAPAAPLDTTIPRRVPAWESTQAVEPLVPRLGLKTAPPKEGPARLFQVDDEGKLIESDVEATAGETLTLYQGDTLETKAYYSDILKAYGWPDDHIKEIWKRSALPGKRPASSRVPPVEDVLAVSWEQVEKYPRLKKRVEQSIAKKAKSLPKWVLATGTEMAFGTFINDATGQRERVFTPLEWAAIEEKFPAAKYMRMGAEVAAALPSFFGTGAAVRIAPGMAKLTKMTSKISNPRLMRIVGHTMHTIPTFGMHAVAFGKHQADYGGTLKQKLKARLDAMPQTMMSGAVFGMFGGVAPKVGAGKVRLLAQQSPVFMAGTVTGLAAGEDIEDAMASGLMLAALGFGQSRFMQTSSRVALDREVARLQKMGVDAGALERAQSRVVEALESNEVAPSSVDMQQRLWGEYLTDMARPAQKALPAQPGGERQVIHAEGQQIAEVSPAQLQASYKVASDGAQYAPPPGRWKSDRRAIIDGAFGEGTADRARTWEDAALLENQLRSRLATREPMAADAEQVGIAQGIAQVERNLNAIIPENIPPHARVRLLQQYLREAPTTAETDAARQQLAELQAEMESRPAALTEQVDPQTAQDPMPSGVWLRDATGRMEWVPEEVRRGVGRQGSVVEQRGDPDSAARVVTEERPPQIAGTETDFAPRIPVQSEQLKADLQERYGTVKNAAKALGLKETTWKNIVRRLMSEEEGTRQHPWWRQVLEEEVVNPYDPASPSGQAYEQNARSPRDYIERRNLLKLGPVDLARVGLYDTKGPVRVRLEKMAKSGLFNSKDVLSKLNADGSREYVEMLLQKNLPSLTNGLTRQQEADLSFYMQAKRALEIRTTGGKEDWRTTAALDNAELREAFRG